MTTRGKLTPATLKNTITNEVVNFMFNPFEYTITKPVTWSSEGNQGKNTPKLNFEGGGARTISLTLHFDGQKSSTDVTTFTKPLWKMAMIDDTNVNAQSGKGQPPPVIFHWGGDLYFKAVITNIAEKFTLFTDKGVPLRCEMTIALQEYVDETDTPAQMAGVSSNNQSASTVTVTQDQRLDHVASQNGTSQREVAAQNNIDNPNKIPPGTQLQVTKKK
jgi:hypothetical protein